MARLKTKIAQAAQSVRPFAMMREPEQDNRHQPQRLKPLPEAINEEVGEIPEHEVGRKTDEFVSFEVTSSKGKKYRVTVPASYYKAVPKVWAWDERKYKVADAIAAGIPINAIAQDPEIGVKSRMTIYAWLEHPEFREHVDALVTETGFASQRERIAGLSRMTQKLFDKLINELSGVKLTDKSIGAIISGIQQGMKHLAQEKGEFIEQQNVTQQTSIEGKLAVASLKVEEVLKSKTEEERAALQAEFNKIGDEIIRGITGAQER